jgi:hypothetical protein
VRLEPPCRALLVQKRAYFAPQVAYAGRELQ